MNYHELTRIFREHENKDHTPKEHLTGHITFSSFGPDVTTQYDLLSRTYAVSSNNKAFIPSMGGYSIYASSLDGSDPLVRLEQYMQEERGGKDGWKVEDCCIVAYLLSTINERELRAQEIYLEEGNAVKAMITALKEKSGYSDEMIEEAMEGTFTHDDTLGVSLTRQEKIAWVNDTLDGNWDWAITPVRIYSTTHIEFGEVKNI